MTPKPKANKGYITSFRTTDQVERELTQLAEKWGENRTQVIKRAIQIAHEREFRRSKKQE